MSDYSLMSVPNRLAVEGEDLIARRFRTGTMGLASPSAPAVCVCIPPGARLVLHDIPERLQHDFAIGPIENVTFVQLSAAEYMHRDAIRFQNGREILLQKLSRSFQKYADVFWPVTRLLPRRRSVYSAGRSGLAG